MFFFSLRTICASMIRIAGNSWHEEQCKYHMWCGIWKISWFQVYPVYYFVRVINENITENILDHPERDKHISAIRFTAASVIFLIVNNHAIFCLNIFFYYNVLLLQLHYYTTRIICTSKSYLKKRLFSQSIFCTPTTLEDLKRNIREKYYTRFFWIY